MTCPVSGCRRLVLLIPGLLICTSALSQPDSRSSSRQTGLKLGVPVEREITGGEVHDYGLQVEAGQFVRIRVDQRGMDLAVSWSGPSGQTHQFDGRWLGTEPVSLIAAAAGTHRMQIRPVPNTAVPSRYSVEVLELREHRPEDKLRIRAESATTEAKRLISQGKADSLKAAIRVSEEALPLFRTLGDKSGEAQALNTLGYIFFSLGQTQKGLELSEQALAIRSATGDQLGQAESLANIGVGYAFLGDRRKALEYYSRALPLQKAAGNRQGETYTLNNLGATYFSLGENHRAIEFSEQALPLCRTLGDRAGEAQALNNLGAAYLGLAEYQTSMDYYSKALPITEAARDRRGEAAVRNNLAFLYQALGQNERVREQFERALQLLRIVGDRRIEARTLINLARAFDELGAKKKALEFYREALVLSRAAGDRHAEAAALNNIGFVHHSLKDTRQALDYLEQAVSLIGEVGDRRGQARMLNNLGLAREALADHSKASEAFTEALSLSRMVGDRETEATTLLNIARLERDAGELASARTRTENALEIIEILRGKVVSQELRSFYLASRQTFYEFYIDLLMRLHQADPKAGYDARALQASERARARSLLELLAESRARIRSGAEPALLERERLIAQRIRSKAEYQARLLSDKHSKEEAEAVRKEVEAALTDYREVQTQIRARSPRYAALTQPQPLTAGEIQRDLLDNDTLLLEYALGGERSFLWVVSTSAVKSYVLPTRATIEELARRVYSLLTERNRRPAAETAQQRQQRVVRAEQQYQEAISDLSRILLGPAAADLGQKRLFMVAGGALQYIPFAGLLEPRAGAKPWLPLVENHEVVSAPSASTLAVARQELAGRRLAPKVAAVIADPVFDPEDSRVDRAAKQSAPAVDVSTLPADLLRSLSEPRAGESPVRFARLPFSRREASLIAALAPAHSTLRALDFSASRATVTSSSLRQYRLVHFATHGILNTVHPELSGLVLSLVDEKGRPQDGFLRLHEIYDLELPAELVVLSACQTGLGKEIRGEGLVGLTRGFMYAGAARLAASLWKVDDEATAGLMAAFYRGMLGPQRLRPAAALRAAQLAMRRSQRWQSPYYWAAFVMQGEWK